MMIYLHPVLILRRFNTIRTIMMKSALLFLGLFLGFFSFAQEFSYKGKDFWLGYGNHEQMNGGNGQGMDIYITSDVNTSALVEIPGIGFSQNVNIAANQVTTVTVPNTAALNLEGKSNKGIHVKADRPVVVYAHIYFQSVSGATLCIPVSTLGQEYYAVNFTQVAQVTFNQYSHSYFFVVAPEDNTIVEIVPSALTLGGKPAGVPFMTTLSRGEVYQVLSETDLTGSVIRSVNSGTGCKKIAVFNGSGRIGIGCGANVSSSDNLIQQMYPSNTWGKKYITVPTLNRPKNYYRIIRPDASAVVTLNGAVLPPAGFINNLYYEFENSQTNVIVSDKPILVAQYLTSQSCGELVPYGDPEMIYLNPVEQTTNDATVASMRLINPSNNSHYINVVLKNQRSVFNSFRIDGNAYNSFTILPQDPEFAYAQIPVNFGTHRLTCDSGFNAIAYGYAQFESYGYSAGTNLRDQYQFISIDNIHGTVDFAAGCKGSPFNFSIVFPYQPAQIKWQFNGLFPDTTVLNPVADSSWVVNGRTIYVYKLKKNYQINNTGTYPIKVVVTNPTADGCAGDQEIDYDLQVFDRPTAAFDFNTNGCLSDSIQFTDLTTNTGGRTITRWSWDFGDGIVASEKNPVHKYGAAQVYQVKFALVTDVGCLSDTISSAVPVNVPPQASFSISSFGCINTPVTFTNTSTPGGAIIKWFWDYGDGFTEITTDGNLRQHIYTVPGNYTVKLKVESSVGCESALYQQDITIHATPLADFNLPDICLPAGAAQFTNLSSIADGTENLLTYLWKFDDPNAVPGNEDASVAKDPVHKYSAAGPYNVTLRVTSNNGCAKDTTKTVSNIFPQPLVSFSAPEEICLGDTAIVQLKTTGHGGVPFVSMYVDPGTGVYSETFNNIPPGAENIAYKYSPLTAGSKKINVYGQTAKGCISDSVSKIISVNPSPTAGFNISTPGCVTQTVTFTDASLANAGNIIKWIWDLGDSTIEIGNSSSPVSHVYSANGIYSASLKIETDKGCISTIFNRDLTITPIPLAEFKLPEVCLNDATALFIDSSTISDGSENLFTYLWDFGNGKTSSQKNPQQKYAATGVYPVSLKVTSKDGCTGAVTKSFTVNGALPKADFNVINPDKLCSNKEVSIINNSSVNFGNISRLEIFWDYNTDPTIKTTDEEPLPDEQYTHRYADFNSPLSKTYQIRMVAYSGTNCISVQSKTVILHSTPQLVFDPVPPVCEDAAGISLTQAREINGVPGAGVFSGPGMDANGIFNPFRARAGVHKIKYAFTSAQGCLASIEQLIKVIPSPDVTAGADAVVLEGGSISLNPSAAEDIANYKWSPATGLDNPMIKSPKATPLRDITYTLTVSSADGCQGSDEVFVKVLIKPVIPNTFTPNGDGYNDRWEIANLSYYPGCIVEVYNPQGQLLFKSVGYNQPWDGAHNGKQLPVGTYYYAIDPKNGRPKIAGYVTIIR